MIDLDIVTASDLQDAAQDPQRLAHVEYRWRQVSGQKSGVTWHYVQILAGKCVSWVPAVPAM
jgi:hypothetical protein